MVAALFVLACGLRPSLTVLARQSLMLEALVQIPVSQTQHGTQLERELGGPAEVSVTSFRVWRAPATSRTSCRHAVNSNGVMRGRISTRPCGAGSRMVSPAECVGQTVAHRTYRPDVLSPTGCYAG